ncbi:uncharacterized protein ACBT57_007043 [Dama dama]
MSAFGDLTVSSMIMQRYRLPESFLQDAVLSNLQVRIKSNSLRLSVLLREPDVAHAHAQDEWRPVVSDRGRRRGEGPAPRGLRRGDGLGLPGGADAALSSALLRLPAVLYGARPALREVPALGCSTKARREKLSLLSVPSPSERSRQPGAWWAHPHQVWRAHSLPRTQSQFPLAPVGSSWQLTEAPSDCPQGTQARTLPQAMPPKSSRDGSPSLALLSHFLSFIFCPTSFRRQWAAFLGA